jgi:hypothetical protein
MLSTKRGLCSKKGAQKYGQLQMAWFSERNGESRLFDFVDFDLGPFFVCESRLSTGGWSDGPTTVGSDGGGGSGGA